ncbi:MAG: PASTA domain-containing protein, partial [Erysipelotrichaceae bacterium]|nr:PASTA domain-containing protein [Erysipelotrichaceae bacterium]
MKTFIANKINLILSFLLVAMLGVSGFFAYALIRSSSKVVVPDFLGKNKEEALEWCGQLDTKYSCEFVYEPSSSVEKDHVFQQSLNSGSVLKDKIVIRVSSELVKPIELPQIKDARKEDIEKWKNDNGITNLTFKEENSDTVAKGNVIRIEPTENISKDTPITVYISLGKKDSGEDKIEVKSGEYVNLNVSRFEEQVKALGLVPNHDTSRDAKSESVAKGNVVWHGSGTYENGETINYGVCLEQAKDTNKADVYVEYGKYIGKTESEFKTIANDLGLKPNHNSDRDAYSDTVEKGKIVWHGSGNYEKDETFNYGLSLGKKNDDSDEIYIEYGKYIGKTEGEFKTIATNLGLKANHNSDRDAYSDTVEKGNIVWHGSGTYVKDEIFNYGLSLGKKNSEPAEVYVEYGTYIGKTEEEFKKIATDLKLIPTHKSSKDDYSDTIPKGSVIWHGSGTYKCNDSSDPFNYGLSLGKKSEPAPSEEIVISAGTYVGKSESDFRSIATGLGLNPNHDSSRDNYSDTIAEGNIIWHGSGTYVKGETFNYGLSLGKKQTAEGNIMRPEKYQVGDTFESTKEKMKQYLSVFTNVEYVGVSSTKGVGRLEMIEVGSYGSGYSAGSYPIDTPIKV